MTDEQGANVADGDADGGPPQEGTPDVDPPAGSSDDGTGDGAGTDDEVDVKALQAELRATRREAAKRRTEQRAMEEKLAEYEKASLTESERLERRNAELEAELAKRDADQARAERRQAIVEVATAKKSIDPSLVADLLVSTLGAEDDIGPAVDDLLKQKPYLKSGTDTGGDANGSTSASRKASEGDGRESDDERRARIWGRGVTLFDPKAAIAAGGGVQIPGGAAQVERRG